MPKNDSINSKSKTTLARLLDKIKVNPDTGCWEWDGFIPPYPRNYGRLTVGGKSRETHRLMYEITFGTIPKGLCVLHKCDVRKCINPEHFFLGTKLDNAIDCKNKGRTASGNKNGSRTSPQSRPRGEKNHSKLTWEKVDEIRYLLALKLSYSKIAKLFSVGKTAIGNIKQGRKWNIMFRPPKASNQSGSTL